MAAPTTQQLKQQQANSPEWQARQQEEMYRQKWQGIFNNVQLCTRYVRGDKLIPMISGTGSDNTIQVPEDDTERKIAQEVAQSVIQNTPKQTGVQEGANISDAEIIETAARKFIRECSVYIKKRNKSNAKEVNKFQKENPGVGTYSQSQLMPMSDSIKDIITAGSNAGKQAAQYYMTSDQASQDALAQQTKQYMQNKCYNVCFWYMFYSNINTSNDQNATKLKTQRLSYLTPLYEQYVQQANPGNIKDTINGKGPTPLDKIRRNMANGGTNNGN